MQNKTYIPQVPQGSYLILEKSRYPAIQSVESSGIESCIVVRLHSPTTIAMCHIDKASLKHGIETLNAMITHLKQDVPAQSAAIPKEPLEQFKHIQAELVGGDFGDPLFNSSKLFKAIKKELDANTIIFTRRDYHSDTSIQKGVVGSIIAGGLTLMVNPGDIFQWLTAIMAVILVFITSYMLQSLGSNPSFKVQVDVKSGDIHCLKSNRQESTMAYESVKKYAPQFFSALEQRYFNGQNHKDLPMIDAAIGLPSNP